MTNRWFLREILAEISDRGRRLIGAERSGAATPADLIRLADALLSGRGEASGVAIAQDILDSYAGLSQDDRKAFFAELNSSFGTDRERLDAAVDAYRNAPTHEAIVALHAVAEPRRQELIRRLNLAPGGTAALVAMRADLIGFLRKTPDLAPVDADFEHLFASWFNRGFLVLRRIDWNTPAAILEKIIRYEAVHEIRDWVDLRHRIDMPDRRLYAFFHPTVADDPLIFVEVALTRDVPDAIAPILTTGRSAIDPTDATTAVFYSISNCQVGLRGISFGNFLIKQVVDELNREFPNLKFFVTLSPVPGLLAWLRDETLAAASPLAEAARTTLTLLESAGWHADAQAQEAVKKALLPLAAHYFLHAKAHNSRPVDPVARFHLGNGARLERLNWLADMSSKGLEQSAGLMVNYLYVLKDIEKNHERYANEGEIVAAGAIRKLMRAPVPQRVAAETE